MFKYNLGEEPGWKAGFCDFESSMSKVITECKMSIMTQSIFKNMVILIIYGIPTYFFTHIVHTQTHTLTKYTHKVHTQRAHIKYTHKVHTQSTHTQSLHTKYTYKVHTQSTHTKYAHKIHTHTHKVHTHKVHTHTQNEHT